MPPVIITLRRGGGLRLRSLGNRPAEAEGSRPSNLGRRFSVQLLVTFQTPSRSDPPANAQGVGDLCERLLAIRQHVLDYENRLAWRIRQVHPAYAASARNLVHYLALRQLDLRPVQAELVRLGLSSLGHSHGFVTSNLDSVIGIVQSLRAASPPSRPFEPFVTYEASRALIERHTEALLGRRNRHRRVRIMVTLPDQSDCSTALMQALLESGMDCARINCARDDAAAWRALIGAVRLAQRQIGQPCRVLMDLAGPKLRTGTIAPGPAVVRWRPQRDELGRVVEPATIWLTPVEAPEEPPGPGTVVPVTGKWLRAVRPKDQITLRDARARRRVLTVTAALGRSRWAICDRTGYVTPGTRLRLNPASRRSRRPATGFVGDLPARPGRLLLHVGDQLVVTADPLPGENARFDANGHLLHPAHVACSLPQVLAEVRPGEKIWFDDGRIGGMVEEASPEQLLVRIEHAAATGSRLAADKGINLPDSRLSVRGLTEQDVQHLDFIARYADTVAMSFLRSADDVAQLQAELRRHGGSNLGIILKIETRSAMSDLPAILLTAMRSYPVGVMIARGDLAVELGFEELALAQEEILSMCEAAHLPTIWATHVLESLTKAGQPSRAELTDAAMSVRADCVMLNRGPYLVQAVQVLGRILTRASEHQRKAAALLAPLEIASASTEAPWGSSTPPDGSHYRVRLAVETPDLEPES